MRVRLRQKAPNFLKIKCRTPSRAEVIGLSIPHRILVILLRRDLLADHQSIESLMAGRELFIRLKEGFSDLPLFPPQGRKETA